MKLPWVSRKKLIELEARTNQEISNQKHKFNELYQEAQRLGHKELELSEKLKEANYKLTELSLDLAYYKACNLCHTKVVVTHDDPVHIRLERPEYVGRQVNWKFQDVSREFTRVAAIVEIPRSPNNQEKEKTLEQVEKCLLGQLHKAIKEL